MKDIRYPISWLIVIAMLLTLAGCGGVTPVPVEVTSTPIVTEVSETSPIERVLSAVKDLRDPEGFSYELHSKTLTKIKVTKDNETLNEVSHLEAVGDKGTWSMNGKQENIAVKRNISYPGSSYYSSNGEVRLVDGQMYLRAAFDQPKEELPAMPDGWVRVNGESTLLYWPNIQELALSYSLQDMRQGPWSLFSSYPAQSLEELFSEHLDFAQQEAVLFPDGSSGEELTFRFQGSALDQTIRYLGEPSPADARALASAQGSPVTMRFTLDEQNRLVQWELSIEFEVADVDLTGTPGSPDGALLEGRFEQIVSVNLRREPPPAPIAAPDASEITSMDAYTDGDQSGLFPSLADFDRGLNLAISDGKLDAFWEELSAAKAMPLVFDDLAVFLYRGEAQSVQWDSDWYYIRPNAQDRLAGSEVWMHTVRLPEEARLEYQLQVDNGEGILDPLNPKVEVGGLGSKSVVEMPGYVPPDFVLPNAEVAQGALTEDTPFVSESLGYMVNYRVYTPAEYSTLSRLPVMYVTDGQDFIAFGKMAVALDNLIAAGRIRPVIAIFIDPRNVKTGENQRNEQFFDNPAYGKFIAEELVPEIDGLYRTNPSPDARLIIGMSNGGYHSIYFSLHHSEVFHLAAAFSPSVWHNPEIIETYRQEEKLPLTFFISTGVFNDSDYHTRQFQDMLKGKGYPLLYLESNEGHSFGNWRGKFDEMLEFFFPGAVAE